jgi:hypothetical protein
VSPRAPRGLSAASRRRWRARRDEFELAGRLTPAVLDSLALWARELDRFVAAKAWWQEEGRPALAAGSVGQVVQHPLHRSVERAARDEARMTMALERLLRRVPKDQGALAVDD